MEAEKRQFVEDLEQRKPRFEEKFEADWAGLEEDLEKRRRLEQRIQECESKLQERMPQLAEKKIQFERQVEEKRARLDRREAEVRRREEELERQHRELDIQVAALDKLIEARQKQMQMQKPLLVQPDSNKNKNCDAWGLNPIVWVIAVVSALAFLDQMCNLLPRINLQYIVYAFTALWAFGTSVLPLRIFKRFRGRNTVLPDWLSCACQS